MSLRLHPHALPPGVIPPCLPTAAKEAPLQSTPYTAALQQQTGTVPIVFVHVSDPIGSGFAASLARPGGNLMFRIRNPGGPPAAQLVDNEKNQTA